MTHLQNEGGKQEMKQNTHKKMKCEARVYKI